MWREEAIWIGQEITKMDFGQQDVNCLNIGSSTRDYRELIKPYINEFVINPIERLGEITHLDAKEADGVDIVGDLTSLHFRRKMANHKYNLVLCNNVLTHVRDVNAVYDAISECLSEGGYVIITAPSQYPYCADPFDSKYRPSRADIEKMLPLFKTVAFTYIESGETMLTRFMLNKRSMLYFFLNILIPRKGWDVWRNTVSDMLDINKPFALVGLVMQKKCNG